MKHAARNFSVLALLAFGCGKFATPHVAVEEEPQPAPWSPPTTSLPRAFVDETAFLLAHGLGDPRGKVYGSAFVRMGSDWGGDDRPVEIHGWLSKGRPLRIVSLGGLVYDVESPGRAGGSLDSDVQSLERAAFGTASKTWMPPAGSDPETEVRLLLILGRTDLAERLYPKVQSERRPMAQPFFVRLFHQAVQAHSIGDDRTALRVGRLVVRERSAFSARLLAQVDPRTHALPNGSIVQNDPYAYLDVVPDLVADSERRLAAPPRTPLDLKTASVDGLIDRLDEVKVRQWGQPGGVDLTQDPVVAALAAKGGEAAEPLFDAMEHDRRLTRSFSFGRDFFPARHLITVREAAFAAFQSFAQTDRFPAGSGTNLDVTALRAYWQANKGKTAPERWFDTLADDRAGWRKWEEAAQRLFDPQGTQRMGFMSRGPDHGLPYAEALRGRTNPSLSDLLERRAHDVLDRNDEGLGGPLMLTTALRMGLDLAQWEPSRCVPLLKDLTHQSIDALAADRMTNDYAGTFVVPAIEARAKAGDPTAWPDYARLLASLKRFPSFDSKLLQPMAEHPDVPEIREATKLLTTPGSLYDAVGRLRGDPGIAGYDSIVISPLLALPSLFQAVSKALNDKTVIGASWIDDRGNGWVEANGKSFPSQGVRPLPGDPKPPAGEKHPLRMADVVAHDLARLKDAPKFQPFWTVAQKDAAIERIQSFLQAHRANVAETVPWPNNWKSGVEEMAEQRSRGKRR